MKKKFIPAVPTTTIIIAKEGQKNMVVIFESTGKHGNKKVLPGGRVKVGLHSWAETGVIEAREEVGIDDLANMELFAVSSKPGRDVRKVTLDKYLDGRGSPEGFSPEIIEIEAHYGFDVAIMATTKSPPIADKNEAKEAYFVDVFEVKPTEYALDHGYLLLAYAKYLKTGKLPDLNEF